MPYAHTRVLRHEGVVNESLYEQPDVDCEEDEKVEDVLTVLLKERGQVLPLYPQPTLSLVDVLGREVLHPDIRERCQISSTELVPHG